MTSQAAMGKTAMTAAGSSDGRNWRSRLFQVPVIVAVAGLVLMATAGLALGIVLVAEVPSGAEGRVLLSIGLAFGTLYAALVLLVWAGSRARINRPEHERRMTEMRTAYDSIVEVLCSALDLRDNVTQGHGRRIAELASVLAWQMGLRKEELRRIEKAAILHDIGKIGVADVVLSKAGPLDDAEWDQMRRHPEVGYRITKEIDFLKDVADVIYAHHERWDGKGYPRGLKGEEIPLGARIFAVVDAYIAMISHRPYRKAMPQRKAIEEIVRNANSQFDPRVVRSFLDAHERGLLESEGGRRDEPSFARRPGELSAALTEELP